MPKNDTLTDPRRTLPAGKLNGVKHVTTRVDGCFYTLCDLPINEKDLMVFAQRPEDITCEECRKAEAYLRG